jgi:hypothetical protein
MHGFCCPLICDLLGFPTKWCPDNSAWQIKFNMRIEIFRLKLLLFFDCVVTGFYVITLSENFNVRNTLIRLLSAALYNVEQWPVSVPVSVS